MQTGLLRCGHYAQTRRPITKTLVAFTGVRTAANKPKTWAKVKKQSHSLLKFDPNSSQKVNKAIILAPPSERIVLSPTSVDKSLQEAAETLQESTIVDKPRKFRANTPFIYNPQRLKDKEDALAVSRFASHTREFLRHTAKIKGLNVLPDGFVRVSDLVSVLWISASFDSELIKLCSQLRDEFYKDYSFEQFADHCLKDPAKDFDLVHLPELIEGELQDVWWVRAKRAHSILVS